MLQLQPIPFRFANWGTEVGVGYVMRGYGIVANITQTTILGITSWKENVETEHKLIIAGERPVCKRRKEGKGGL